MDMVHTINMDSAEAEVSASVVDMVSEEALEPAWVGRRSGMEATARRRCARR